MSCNTSCGTDSSTAGAAASAAINWQCPICFQNTNDATLSIVPCIIASCYSATHPICLDCCWKMRKAEHAFNCPLCKTPATLLMPLHCMVANSDREAQAKIKRAEDDLRPQKQTINTSLVECRKITATIHAVARGIILPMLWIVVFCIVALAVVYLAFMQLCKLAEVLYVLVGHVFMFCFEPRGFAICVLIVMQVGSSKEIIELTKKLKALQEAAPSSSQNK